tara:strand:+ start:630 stop:860 length:231 start_codon:yes stop_codon:yes gene_type:complete
MFYSIEKLNELEKTLSENLMKADGHTWDQSHKPHWLNYRNDIPNCISVIREFKELLHKLKLKEENNGNSSISTGNV